MTRESSDSNLTLNAMPIWPRFLQPTRLLINGSINTVVGYSYYAARDTQHLKVIDRTEAASLQASILNTMRSSND